MNDTSYIYHQYKILEELHGSSSRNELVRIVASDFSMDYREIIDIINGEETQPKREYGLIIGRFQPFHYGHQHIINEVLLDGKTPLIVLGDDQGENPKRNPLTVEQRKELITLVYPKTRIEFVSVSDNSSNWDLWWKGINEVILGNDRNKEQITLFFNNKESDRYDHFEVCGKEYKDEFYSKVFSDNNYKTQQVEFVERTDIKVDADATNIRNDFENFKHLMDARVYWKLKEWGW